MKPLVSVQHLAHLVGLSVTELRELATDVDDHYFRWTHVDEKRERSNHWLRQTADLRQCNGGFFDGSLPNFHYPIVLMAG